MEMTPEELDEQFGDHDDVEWEGDGEDGYPYNCHDLSDDGEALASAGFGTDEDYGYYGDGDDW